MDTHTLSLSLFLPLRHAPIFPLIPTLNSGATFPTIIHSHTHTHTLFAIHAHALSRSLYNLNTHTHARARVDLQPTLSVIRRLHPPFVLSTGQLDGRSGREREGGGGGRQWRRGWQGGWTLYSRPVQHQYLPPRDLNIVFQEWSKKQKNAAKREVGAAASPK